MTEPVRPLEALIAKWRESAQWESESNMQYAQALDQCADELAALLQAAAPPAPTAEQEITRALDLARKALFTPPNGALVCRWCHANWTTDGHTEWCHYVEICRDISDASEAIRIAQTKMRSAAPPERVSEGKEEWPSNELLMMRAQQICERLNHNHNGIDVQFVFHQLQMVRMYAACPAVEPREEPR